jgi:hypothetical protein
MRILELFAAILFVASGKVPPKAGKAPPAAPAQKGSAKSAQPEPGQPAIAGSTGGLLEPEDWEPRVEIRLSPPRHPLPDISSKIELLDQSRRIIEERQTTKLLKAYDEEISRSRKLITALIRKAFEAFDDPAVVPPLQSGSLFELGDLRERPGRIWISVEASPPVDGAVVKRIESMERKNAKQEFSLFQSAIEDMHEVTRMTLQHLNESLVNVMRPVIKTSFIDLSPAVQRCQELQLKFGKKLVPSCSLTSMGRNVSSSSHTVSVFADEHTYPTVESLVQDMLKRREVDEELFRTRSIALMGKLAQEQSTIVQELLQAAVSSITVQYKRVIRAVNTTREEQKQYDLDHPKEWKKSFIKHNR